MALAASLSHSPSCLFLLVLFTFFLVVLLLHRVSLRRLCSSSDGGSYFCGAKMHPLIGCLLPFYKNRHRLLDWYTELLAASPNLTIVVQRLGARRTIITANPDNVEHILKSNFPNYPKGKPFTDVLGDLLGRGIFNADGELWYAQRKLASHEFSARSLRELLVATLELEARERLLPALASAASGRRAVDVQDLLRRFAFDAICRVSLGADPRYLDASMPASELAEAFDVASMISAMRGAAPIAAVWKVKRALGVGSERALSGAIRRIHRSITEIIRTRKEQVMNGESERNDLLTRLVSGDHSDEVVRDMVISFVMAGKDTTSAALTWFFWLISHHPDAEREVVRELRRLQGQRLDHDALKEMRVLEACLCESMRLYPPVSWDSKHAAAGDLLPDGTRVEVGDRVTYVPYAMGRMERLWGNTCAEFDYRRWLSDGREEVVKASPYKFSVFQAGPRICLGKEMAFVQMKYVAAAVLSEFELRRDEGREVRPPVLVPLLTAHMAGGLPMLVERRIDK